MIKKSRGKRKERLSCPKCRRKNSVVIIDIVKKNWPFGRKSKPMITIKRKKKLCTNCSYREIKEIIEKKGYGNINKARILS